MRLNSWRKWLRRAFGLTSTPPIRRKAQHALCIERLEDRVTPSAGLRVDAATAFNASEGATSGPVVLATFTDANPGDHTADFSTAINWGDGTAIDTGSGAISYDSGSGVYTVTGSHVYAEEGGYFASVRITDATDGFAVDTGVGLDGNGAVVTAASQTAGAWYPDRFPPSGFVGGQTDFGRTGVIDETISAADADGSRPPAFNTGFYDFQGRKYDLPAGSTYVTLDLYVPSAWAGLNQVDPAGNPANYGSLASLWGAGVDGANTAVSFPIIGFNNLGTNNGNAGPAGFEVFDGANGWTDVPGFAGYDQWYQLSFGVSGGNLVYFVNGSQVYVDTTVTGTVAINNEILQGYNGGNTYTIDWNPVQDTPATVADQQIQNLFLASPGFTPPEGAGIGGPFSGVATFTDPAGQGVETAADFSATVDWGDGTAGAATVVSDGGGNYHVDIPDHTYADEGDFNLSVTVKHDLLPPVTSNSVVLTVNEADVLTAAANQPTIPSIIEGGAFSGDVAAFTDVGYPTNDPADFTATIDWGDGSAIDTSGDVSSDGAGTFTVSGTHKYADEGNFTVTVTLSDNSPGTATATASNSAAVADADALAAGANQPTISATEGTPFSGPVAVFTDTGYPTNDPADFSATIDWGDGSPLDTTGTVSSDGQGTFTVSGAHTYKDEGSFTVKVTLADEGGTATVASGFYGQTNLVSDLPGTAVTTDPDLKNPWGIAFGPTSPFWIADNGTGLSTLYNGSGVKQALVVIIPPPSGSPAGTHSAPTGAVFNSTSDFLLPTGGKALFLFATEDGTLAAWNGAQGTTAIRVGSPPANAVYKGLALANNGAANFLYATDFHNAAVDVFDTNFNLVTPSGGFVDPNLPAGYAPFGIQNVGGKLYVTYAVQDAAKHDDVAGAGHGLVDEYDANGNLIRRFASFGTLNSPWGIALAPATFGAFANDLLIGNFGDGTINAFDPASGNFLGQLDAAPNRPVTIDGLWGLAFGNAGTGFNPNKLYFTAGLNDEADGLFGSLSVVPANVATVAEADVLAAAANQPTISGVNEGASFSGAVAAFTDTGYPTNDPADFSATIDWGDGSPLDTTGTVSSDGQGTFTVSGTHKYAEEGNFTVTVTLSDDSPGTATATATNMIDVADQQIQNLLLASPGFTPPEGAGIGGPFSGVATFTDPAGQGVETAADFSATVDWGDGTAGAATVVSDGGGNYHVDIPDHTYADEGDFNLSVTVKHDLLPPLTSNVQVFTVKEADVLAPAVSQPTIPGLIEGVSFSGAVAAFTDTGYPTNDPADFTATIDWGDGTATDTGAAVGITSDGAGHFTVSGSHSYVEEGTFTVTVTLADDAPGTSSATATNTAAVADQQLTNLTTAALPTGKLEGAGIGAISNIATFTDPAGAGVETAAGDFTATINWGDATTSPGTVVSDGGGNYHVSAPDHVYAEEGTFTVNVTLKHDALPAVTTPDKTIVVADQQITSLTSNVQPTAVADSPTGASVGIATFTDPAGAGVETPAGDFTATINWGDTTTSPGTIVPLGGGNYRVDAPSHTYHSGGTFTVTVTVRHDLLAPQTTAGQSIAVAPAPIAGLTAVPVTGFEFDPDRVLTLATFTAGANTRPASAFAATITWGDGTTSTGTVAQSGSGAVYVVTASHNFTDEGNYAVGVTVSDGTSSATTGATATIQEELLPDGTRGTANQRFVSELYRDLLHRKVDASGLATWTAQLDGGASRPQVVSNIQHDSSHEYFLVVVRGLYQQDLHRTPSDAEILAPGGFVAQLVAGSTIEQVARAIVTSPEFTNGRDNNAFVLALYEDALGRDGAGDPGFATHVQALNAETRAQVADDVFSSREYRQDLVKRYYLQFLDRPFDQPGLDASVAQLNAGVRDEAVLANMLGDPVGQEYFNKTKN